MKKGWQTKKLGELLEIQNGFAFNSRFFNPNGKMPLIRIRDLKVGTDTETRFTGEFEEKYVVKIGDLLIGMDGEFGCYEWKGKPALLNQRVCRLQKFLGELSPRFLFYGINSYLKDIEAVTGYATVKHISSKQILDIKFPIPTLSEQQRIVRILDEAFEGIGIAKANAEKNLQNAREVFESHLQYVFTQRDSSHAVKRLDEVCEEITVGHVGPMVKQYRDVGIPFLRSQNIRPFRISLENVVFIDEKFHRALAKSQLKPGDVAVVRTGYPGTAAVIPDSLPISNCSDLVIVRPGLDADPNYLALFFNSRLGKDLVAGRLVGAAQKHFNINTAKQVAISFPPVSEQRRLAAKIEEFGIETHHLESIYQRKLTSLDELKKSLLRRAFNGEL